MSSPIAIEAYDPGWPGLYELEKAAILQTLGEACLAIEHMGSTAVPGLGAKPIIDIMVGIGDLSQAPVLVPRLAALRYEYAPAFEALIPERRFFRKGPAEARTHHLHMVELEGEFWRRHLLFHDYLRAHPETAEDYERLKRELAAHYGADHASYSEAKTDFVRSVEAAAREEQLSRDGAGRSRDASS